MVGRSSRPRCRSRRPRRWARTYHPGRRRPRTVVVGGAVAIVGQVAQIVRLELGGYPFSWAMRIMEIMTEAYMSGNVDNVSMITGGPFGRGEGATPHIHSRPSGKSTSMRRASSSKPTTSASTSGTSTPARRRAALSGAAGVLHHRLHESAHEARARCRAPQAPSSAVRPRRPATTSGRSAQRTGSCIPPAARQRRWSAFERRKASAASCETARAHGAARVPGQLKATSCASTAKGRPGALAAANPPVQGLPRFKMAQLFAHVRIWSRLHFDNWVFVRCGGTPASEMAR